MADIVLALNQNANTKECGSCYFFKRNDFKSEWDQSGRCKLKFPPNKVFMRNFDDAENEPTATVKDTDSCDFWKSSGNTFIVSQKLKP
jgi:hypothetical protein